MSADPREARCPYPGLEAFTAENRRYFVGRERDTQLLISNLYAAPLTVVYGSSGVGKTSVILAGVVPEVEREADAIVVVHRTWQDAARARSLRDRLAEAVGRRLGAGPIRSDGPLDDVAEKLSALARRPVFLVFDQFEEYFLHNEPSDAPDSLDGEVARLINRRDVDVHVMIVLREDSLAALDRFRHRIPSLLNNLYRLEHLTRDEAVRAIEEPLATLGREPSAADVPHGIEPGLAAAILEDLSSFDTAPSGIGGVSDVARVELPFLQVVLERLWLTECRGHSPLLRHATFRGAGGARGIVRQRIEESLDAVPESEQLVIASVLRHLVTPSGAKIALTLNDLQGYADVPEPVVRSAVDRLVSSEARLLRRVAHPSGDRTLTKYEIYHDALGAPLLAWRMEIDRRRGELEQRAKRRVRDMIGTLIALVVIAALVAVSLQRGKSRLEARELAGTAAAQLDVDNGRALLLALAAIEQNDDETAGEIVLRRALFEPGERMRASTPATMLHLVASHSGRHIAGVDEHHRLHVWTTDSLRPVPVNTDSENIVDVAFDSTGNRLLVVAPLRVTLTDLTTNRTAVVDTPGPARPAQGGRVLGDGSRLLIRYADASVTEWLQSAGSWVPARRSPDAVHIPEDFVIGPDGRWLAYAPESGSVAVIALTATPWPRPATYVVPPAPLPPALGFASASELAVASGFHVHVLDVTTGNVGRRFEISCEIAAIVRAGHEASGPCWNGGFVSFNLPDMHSQARMGTEPPLVNRPGRLRLLQLSGDGRFALTLGERDATPTVWSRFGRAEATRLRGHRGEVNAAVFLPDSRHVITAGADSTLRSWEIVAASRRLGDGEFMAGRATVVLNDSATHAGLVSPYGVQIVDLRRGGTIVESPVRSGFPVIALSPDGNRIAALTENALVEEYSVEEPLGGFVWSVPVGQSAARGAGELAASATSQLTYVGNDTLLLAAGVRQLAGDVKADIATSALLARLTRTGGRGAVIAQLPSPVLSLALDSAHASAAVARADGVVAAVDVRTGAVTALMRLDGSANVVAFASGGRVVAGGSDGTVRFASAPQNSSVRGARGPAMTRLGAHERAVVSLALDRSRRIVASGDDGGTVRLWQLDQRDELCSLEGQHADAIRALAFAPSGRTIATADERGVALWFVDAGAATCSFAYRLADLEAPTQALKFAPDGSALVVVGRDGIARVYERRVWAPRDSLIALARQRLRGRTLTDEEQRRYIERR